MLMTLPTPVPAPQKESLSTLRLLAVAGQIGYMVAIPAVVLGFAGAYADTYFGTKPWITLAGLAFALFVSMLAVYRIVTRILDLSSRS